MHLAPLPSPSLLLTAWGHHNPTCLPLRAPLTSACLCVHAHHRLQHPVPPTACACQAQPVPTWPTFLPHRHEFFLCLRLGHLPVFAKLCSIRSRFAPLFPTSPAQALPEHRSGSSVVQLSETANKASSQHL